MGRDRGRAAGVLRAAPVGDRCGRTCARPRSAAAGGGRLPPPGPGKTAGAPAPRPGSPRGPAAVPWAEGGVGGPRGAGGAASRRVAAADRRPPAPRSRAPRAPAPDAARPSVSGLSLASEGARAGADAPAPRGVARRQRRALLGCAGPGHPRRSGPRRAAEPGASPSARSAPSSSVAGAPSPPRLVNASPRSIFQGQKFFQIVYLSRFISVLG